MKERVHFVGRDWHAGAEPRLQHGEQTAGEGMRAGAQRGWVHDDAGVEQTLLDGARETAEAELADVIHFA